jgi:hypothetical protein
MSEELKPVAYRFRHKSEAGMIGFYPWGYVEGSQKQSMARASHDYEDLYTRAQLDAEAAKERERCANRLDALAESYDEQRPLDGSVGFALRLGAAAIREAK